jgi:putative restriction endonuclease
MAKLSKQALFLAVEDAIRDSGWNLLHLGSPKDHPARYQVYRDGKSHTVRVYIWNLSHGGGAKRPTNEYRIQITGIPNATGAMQFQPETKGKTLILGWWEQAGVFAGFDYNYHKDPLGESPSIQIKDHALYTAHENGFSPQAKGNGELAIAFRPDFIGTYIDTLEELHECGKSEAEVEILDEIGSNPASVEDSEIENGIATDRQYAVVTTKRALRDLNFRDRIMTAYGHRCAICGLQLKMLDAAHIVPVFHSGSSDSTSNGIALCALHHRAYDRGFVTFDDKFQIWHNKTASETFKATGHDGGLKSFLKSLRPVLILPPDKKDRPAKDYINIANALRGW